jgi:pilus assembly protein CpaB
MRRGRILILFALIVLFGVAAVYLVMRRGGGGGGPAPEETPLAPQDTTMVVFSNQDIARGSVIPEDGVGLQPYPRDMVVETMIENDLSRVVGHHARQDIPRGVPVTTGMITDRAGDVVGMGSDAAFAIPPGYTAVSVPLTRLSGIAYALRDGDQVDIIMSMLMVDLDPEFQTILPNQALSIVSPDFGLITGLICTEFKITSQGTECTNPSPPPVGRPVTEEESGQLIFNVPTEAQRPRLVTQRIVQNATVLHVGTFATAAEEAAPVVQAIPETAPGETTTNVQPTPVAPLPPDIVTLIVTPQDALTINWAIGSGASLTFTLRSPDDTTATDTVSVTLQYLMQTYNVTLPVRLPYGMATPLENVVAPVLPNDQSATP